MNLKQNFEHGKLLFNQGIDLLLLRLQLLSLNLAEQAGNAFRLSVWLLIACALLPVGLISLLFGLNRILNEQAAVWTFFSIAAVCVLLLAAVLCATVSAWKNRNNEIAAALNDIREDIVRLRGEKAESAAGETRE